MGDERGDPHPDSLPEDDEGNDIENPPGRRDRDPDPRPDIEQAVEARSDAVAHGEGGPEPETFTAPDMPDGVGGTGGVTKNQDDDAQ